MLSTHDNKNELILFAFKNLNGAGLNIFDTHAFFLICRNFNLFKSLAFNALHDHINFRKTLFYFSVIASMETWDFPLLFFLM